MHLDPIIPPLVSIVLVVLLLGLLLQFFRQPQLVGYIVTGMVIGPSGLGLIEDTKLVEHLGALGVTLLLFFIGMEVSPKKLATGWRIAVFGTLFQIIVSVLTVWGIGQAFGWSIQRVVLLGFVISLSSTAVVLKLLKDNNELESRSGENVLLILLAQDLAVIPMLIFVSLLSGSAIEQSVIITQIIGGMVMVAFSAWVLTRTSIRLPFASVLKKDHELQLFAALLACFGMAFITGFLGLSAALGAFVAGLVIAAARETEWVHHALDPLRIVFVAILFVSMGMLLNIQFLQQHIALLLTLLVGVLLTNTLINALILKAFGNNWGDSLYSGALLSQVGEFSFVLATVGLQVGLITQFGYQATIALIALSLLVSPVWIQLSKHLINRLSETQL